MKKTFTLLATAVLFTSAAFAQYNGNRSRDNGYDNNVVINTPGRGYGHDDRGGNYFAEREKNMQIAQINREYNHRIMDVRDNFFMGRFKKQRKIEALEFQRSQEIHEVIEKFNRVQYRHRDRDNRDRRNW